MILRMALPRMTQDLKFTAPLLVLEVVDAHLRFLT
jgi:hypothetical protein